jgi:TPR repeat protein
MWRWQIGLLSIGVPTVGPVCNLQTAEQLLNNEKFQEAYSAYLSLAEDGQLDAQVMVAWMKENGRGVSRDLAGALEWYRKAAERGSSVAEFHLGTVLMKTGEKAEAFLWYTKAASSAYMPAVYRLAWAYETGAGAPIDKDRAFDLFKKNASRGHLPSELVLAKKMLKGSHGNFNRILGIYYVLKTYLQIVLIAWTDLEDDRVRV